MLGIGVRDATAGFRAYRARTLRAIGLDEIMSQGYCFQIDLTLRTAQEGFDDHARYRSRSPSVPAAPAR